jgi:hypothetical protein
VLDHFPHLKCTSSADHSLRLLVSHFLFIIILVVIIISILCLFFAKKALRSLSHLNDNGFEYGGIIIPVIQTLLILIFDFLSRPFIIWLTHFENHRTDASHEASLVIKTCLFRFVTNYVALFYIAFVKPFISDFDTCTADNCMKELQVSLGTILFMKLIVNLGMKIVYYSHKQHAIIDHVGKMIVPSIQSDETAEYPLPVPREETSGESKCISRGNDDKETIDFSREYMKPNYDAIDGWCEDYSSHVILFGYISLFVASFPIAFGLALAYTYVESRLLSWKLSFIHRRPMPR